MLKKLPIALLASALLPLDNARAGWTQISGSPPPAYVFTQTVWKGAGSFDKISVEVSRTHFEIDGEVYDYGNIGAGGTVDHGAIREHTTKWSFTGAVGTEPGQVEKGLAKINQGSQQGSVYITLIDAPCEGAGKGELVWESSLRSPGEKLEVEKGGASASPQLATYSAFGFSVTLTANLGTSLIARGMNKARTFEASTWVEADSVSQLEKATATMYLQADSTPPTGANVLGSCVGVQAGSHSFDAHWVDV